MATSVMQVRVDDDLRAKAAAVYEELGIDLPTANVAFLQRCICETKSVASMTSFFAKTVIYCTIEREVRI